MQGKLYHYTIIKDLAKKYSHVTHLAAATDTPERQVVLITFTASLFSFPYEREAVLEKAQAVKKLQHPHLLSLLDMGIADEQPFVVRKYLPTQSLRSRLKQLAPQRLALQDALTLVLQVGEALALAHTHNIFHGNIKPENILLAANGQALLADFTLFNRTDAMIRDQTTEEYAFCYQAPEQFTGTWGAYSDQYALGCLTYELITGQVPFATQTLTSMLGSYNYTPPIPPTEQVPTLPSELASAVLKALAKDPSERFFDFSLFLEVIRSIVSPPPRFPLLRSAASSRKKTLSRLASSSKIQTMLASSVEPTPPAISLSQVFETPNVISSPEHEQTNNTARTPIDALFLADQAEETANALVPANEAMTTALPNYLDLDIPQTQPISPKKRRKVFSLVLLGLLIAAIGYYAFFSLSGTDPASQSLHSAPFWIPADIPAITNALGGGTPVVVPAISQATLQSPAQTNTAPQANGTSPANGTPQATITPPANGTPQVTITPPANGTPQATITPLVNATPQVTPTPTPTPVPVTHQTVTVNDSVQGTGNNQFNYAGAGWKHGSPKCQADPCEYDNDNSWDSTTNDYVTITFTGVQLRFYGVVDVKHGIGAVSMDGGGETMIDFYATSRKGNQLLWTSPTLSEGTHTFKLRVTGTKNPSSSDVAVTVDRADLIS